MFIFSLFIQPVIPLPDKVSVVTGEEQEEELFVHRAKLYRKVGSEWKERGLGNIKILHHTNNDKVRLLMRREQVHKICLNHYLTKVRNNSLSSIVMHPCHPGIHIAIDS